jgi:hypothetical protein
VRCGHPTMDVDWKWTTRQTISSLSSMDLQRVNPQRGSAPDLALVFIESFCERGMGFFLVMGA